MALDQQAWLTQNSFFAAQQAGNAMGGFLVMDSHTPPASGLDTTMENFKKGADALGDMLVESFDRMMSAGTSKLASGIGGLASNSISGAGRSLSGLSDVSFSSGISRSSTPDAPKAPTIAFDGPSPVTQLPGIELPKMSSMISMAQAPVMAGDNIYHGVGAVVGPQQIGAGIGLGA